MFPVILSPMLIVFGGLPGGGKTTLARVVAEARAAVYLRIDAIEQALRDAGIPDAEIGPGGYMAAMAVAEANLRLGRLVVADAANLLEVAREGWRAVAAATGVTLVEIEIQCTDPTEHRRRVETRASDISGLVQPTWPQVLARERDPWTRPHVVLDTAGRDWTQSLADAQAAIDAAMRGGVRS